MRKRITPIGNSAGIILDKPILALLGWSPGTEVELHLSEDGALVLRAATDARQGVREHARHVMRRRDKTFKRLAE